MNRFLKGGLAALALYGATAYNASAVGVAMELALVVDESGSVNNSEWILQRNGYVAAFQDAAIQNAIIQAGGIAVTYIQFADGVQTGVGWTLINDAASANAFATAIANQARFGNSGTGVARALDYAWKQFGTEVGLAANGFESTRQVIDVSGDGANNRNLSGGTSGVVANLTQQQRDAALAAGIDKINGVVISPNGEAGLLNFYQTQIQGGSGSFTITADTFADFEPAIMRKITAEITNTSLPDGGSSLMMLSLALGGIVAFRRNQKA